MLTAGGVSGAGLLTEPSWLGTARIDAETGSEIGSGDVLCRFILVAAA